MFPFLNPWSRYLTALRRLTVPRRRKGRRRTIHLDLELLDNRQLLSCSTTSGITECTTPTASAAPLGITLGPDGNLWFTEQAANNVAKVTPAFAFTEHGLGSTTYTPQWITPGPDGNFWFTEPSPSAGNDVAKSTTAFTITQYLADNGSNRNMGGITLGPDGNLWFTEVTSPTHNPPTFVAKLGKITTSGTVTLYTVTTHSTAFALGGIVAGPDGNLWFDESSDNKIGVMSTGGTLRHEYPVTTLNSDPYDITVGPDNNLWFTEAGGNNIGRITTGGSINEFPVPTLGSVPHGITAGPDGNLWFTENSGNKLGSLNPGNDLFAEIGVPTGGSGPEGITPGPNGTLWFTENTASKIGTLDWLLQAGTVQSDPGQGLQLGIDGQAGSGFSPHTGNLHVEAPLDFNLSSGPCGCQEALAYNSDTVHVRPLIALSLTTVPGDPVPTTLQAQLTWNNGTPQPWVTVGTSGLSGGGTYWFALQVSSPVAVTGVYPWKVEVQATLPNGGGTVDRTFTGPASVIATDNTTSVDPFGPGWSVPASTTWCPCPPAPGSPPGCCSSTAAARAASSRAWATAPTSARPTTSARSPPPAPAP
jgi:virginiamycin B lyase